jgi:adenine-specific DNA-methyltransferase
MDKVANTAGTYYAYLKALDRKAKNQFCFQLLEPVKGKYGGRSYKMDAIDLLAKQKYDVIYLDPPYNERKYHLYYHLPETIASCSRPKISGRSGVSQKKVTIESNFYQNLTAVESLKKIIEKSKFKVLIFHYRDDGLISPKEIRTIFKEFKINKEANIFSLGYTTKSESRRSKNHIYILNNAK